MCEITQTNDQFLQSEKIEAEDHAYFAQREEDLSPEPKNRISFHQMPSLYEKQQQ